MAGKLTDKTIKALTLAGRPTVGRHTDGGGLHLHVRADGRAGWVLRYRLNGNQRDMGLGTYPEVPLRAARDAAVSARTQVKAGIDPVHARKVKRAEALNHAAPERTFKAAAEALIEAKRPGWRSSKHADQWAATLAAYAYPAFGDWPVGDVSEDAVLRALRPIWTRRSETASRLRGRIEAVLDYAKAQKWRTGENPARWKGHLSHLLVAPRKAAPVRHRPSLPWQRLPDFMRALAAQRGMSALALQFAILTAARSGEVRGARWLEFDLERETWVIGGSRMKGGKIHRVPLSGAALALLEHVKPLATGPQDFVFPGAREGKPLSGMSLSMLVRGMATDGLAPGEPARWRDEEGRVVVPHGFRTTFKAWSLVHGWPDHLSEAAIAHAERNKSRASYAREDGLEERRPMMAAWARLCETNQGSNTKPTPTQVSDHRAG